MAPNKAKAPTKPRKEPTEVGAAEFKARCLELIDRVNEARAEYLVTRHGRPVARLVPVAPLADRSPFGTMKGTVLQFDRPFDPVPAVWSLDTDDAAGD